MSDIIEPPPQDSAPPTSPQGSPPYLATLNPVQRGAVEAVDGPVLVLAGAGTGKTRVLITRLAHILVTRKAFPGQILAVTFTNKAAREMRERVAGLVGPVAEDLWIGTFHAIAARILRRHAEIIGLKSNFTILDSDDQIRLLKQILEANDIDHSKWPARALLAIIQRWKDRGLVPEKVSSSDVGEFAGGKTIELYKEYQQRLITLNACDFGDLLLHNLTLFTSDEMILSEYQRRLSMFWSMNIRIRMSRSICGCVCWPKPIEISVVSGTMTNRFIVGAVPKSATFSDLKRTSPERRSIASSRTIVQHRKFSPQPLR